MMRKIMMMRMSMVEMVMKMMMPVMNMYRPDVASSVNPLLPPFTWQAAVKNGTYWILMRADMKISIEQNRGKEAAKKSHRLPTNKDGWHGSLPGDGLQCVSHHRPIHPQLVHLR